MAETTKIGWTDSTFNPWIGCTKVSPGCDHCYAEISTPSRTKAVTWGSGEPRHRTKPGNWNLPRRWNAAHAEFFAKHGRRQRVFCASLSDVFDNEVDPTWREDLWQLIRETPHLDWMVLTKRIGNVAKMLPEDWGDGYSNIWLGITVVNQEEVDRDIPKLLDIPSRVRFLSAEPLMGQIDLRAWIGVHHHPDNDRDNPAVQALVRCARRAVGATIDWVIVGGKSGPQGGAISEDWVKSIDRQCREAGVPFFFKQWGGKDQDKGGCILSGREVKEWPLVA